MSEVEIIGAATQFGTAGLIAWMWLLERRSAAERERQVSQAHERLMDQRVQVDALLEVVRDNTRAVAAVEAGQRALAGVLQRWEAGPIEVPARRAG